jgi:hypothetical protein
MKQWESVTSENERFPSPTRRELSALARFVLSIGASMDSGFRRSGSMNLGVGFFQADADRGNHSSR